jgi:hypothetical protein
MGLNLKARLETNETEPMLPLAVANEMSDISSKIRACCSEIVSFIQ